MIESLGGDVKPLAESPSSLHTNWKECKPLHCSKMVGCGVAVVMIYLTCAVIGLDSWGGVRSYME